MKKILSTMFEQVDGHMRVLTDVTILKMRSSSFCKAKVTETASVD